MNSLSSTETTTETTEARRAGFTVGDALFLSMFMALAFGGAMAGMYVWPAHSADACIADSARYLCQQPEDRVFLWKEVTASVVWIVVVLCIFAKAGHEEREDNPHSGA